MILGLAGKACSGKNSASRFLEERGFLSLDVDKLGHEALELRRDAVIESFGNQVANDDGTVNRKALGEIVFGDRKRMKELESITHPAVFEMVQSFLEENKGRNLVINAAILGPAGLDRLCDAVLWVEAPLIHRIIRAFKRDKNKISHIFSRIRLQRHLTVQHFFSGVDIYMVRNRGSLSDLKKQVDMFLSDYENF
ncbi:dephospho-CoA kinase [Spirochaeta isovalerica]|uniref:Dephospho-CoA kinase n=1 Tax=Spirochaeta isovalerica TaxID=150 RepID=A0A841RGX6_9SPIO|nr:dephospho-CoA kinase [Spirochaeta isovalerica]MBB6481572.1 dephospho-CoA kinase [Spirochaeta isovalerica]